MRITLNGYYGFANYGDELFNLTTVLAAQRWWGGHHVDILGPPVPGIAAEYRVPAWFPTALYTGPGAVGKAIRLAFCADAMLRRDLLLYAGGSTLSYGSILKKIQRIAAERNCIKFAGIGVSIGPFADAADEAEAARFLRKFTCISVRDRRSMDHLRKMDIPVKALLARDLVGALPLLLPEGETMQSAGAGSARKPLGISLRDYEWPDAGDTAAAARKEALFKGVERFVKRERVPVRIFCLNTHPRSGDQAMSSQLAERLTRQGAEVEVISAKDNLLGCWHGLASCSAVFTVRLHGAITAYLCGVPLVQIEYHDKCTDLMDDIGQHASLRIGGGHTDPAAIEQVLDRLYRNPPPPALPRETYMAEAALNFTQVPWATDHGTKAAEHPAQPAR